MGMPTAMAQSMAQMLAGPVQVVFDPDDTATELFAKGGQNVTFGRGQEDLETDNVGVYDKYSSGDSITFELNVPERSLTVIDVLFPEGADGTLYRGFGRAAGRGIRQNALAVRIRPWQARALSTRQVDIWLCVPEGDAVLNQQMAEHTYVQTFRALPDLDHDDGMLLARITEPARS